MTVRLRATIALALVLLTFYLLTLGWRAVILIIDGGTVAVLLGVALLAIAVVGVWAAVAEIRFGLASARLGRRLADEGGLPPDDVVRLPSGRIDRAAADTAFEGYRAEVDADSREWRAWYRLALAYDLAGDRRRARGATRTAIRLAAAP